MLAIVGPTGTGKSALSLTIAERLLASGREAEVVNADAMQLYRGMDIGTAKLTPGERRGVPHHLIDVLDPVEDASVAWYQQRARAAIEEVLARGAVPILVGGSGLYVAAVLREVSFPGTDAAIRARLEDELAADGVGRLHLRLAELDPGAAAAIDPRNARRVVRALEVVELTGAPFTAAIPGDSPWRPALTIGLESERARLVDRLDARVERMWRDGLVDEVARLEPGGFGTTASRAIGYAQALDELHGVLGRTEAIEEAKALTRRYARRQLSWFRRYADTVWFDADGEGLVDAVIAELAAARLTW